MDDLPFGRAAAVSVRKTQNRSAIFHHRRPHRPQSRGLLGGVALGWCLLAGESASASRVFRMQDRPEVKERYGLCPARLAG
jgi:hypothetical protein